MPQHEKLNYVEFAAKDLEKTKAFFHEVFNWAFTDYGPDYAAFSDGVMDGGFYKADMANSTRVGGALLVFYSDDIQATLKKVVNAGGSVTKPIFDFPGGSRFHFTEPSGNEMAVWATSR